MSIDHKKPDVACEQADRNVQKHVQHGDSPSAQIPSLTPAEDLDPRLSELIGFADASRASRLSYWTFHNAYRRGEIRGVYVPGGAVGLLRVDVQRFIRLHRQRLRDRKTKAAAADSDVRSA